jgi:subtilase family serine protease
MRTAIKTRFATSLIFLLTACLPAMAQVLSRTENPEPARPVPSRIQERIDDSRVVRLTGNTHPMARAQFDRGPVEPGLPMQRMVMLLRRSDQQEADLNTLMDGQLDPKSPNFHHWLTPNEFGTLYGPSEYDIAAVTNWLQNHGFSIDRVAHGRMYIEFSGTASTVQEAFHTEIRRYLVEGEEHIANNVDPAIPEALSPVVTGIVSLHNFRAKTQHRYLGSFTRTGNAGKWTPQNPELVSKPLFTVPGSDPTFELVAPNDFATIYNLKPLWAAGINGSGQTIAIAGRTDISLADVQNFRSTFGLPKNDPTFLINGADPGVSADDKVENTLDVEWSGAAAPMAKIIFVTTASTNTSDGASSSAMYIIDNNVAKIMSFSYGNCELKYGTAGNAFNNSLWQQGAAQGISEFVASGDQGSAACDGGQQAPYGADYGLQVSGSSSTPYNIAVGGTDFNWANLSKSYWSSSNGTTASSALSYIPETTWNATCASTQLDLYLGATAAGLDPEQTCQYELNNSFNIQDVNVAGGTGGKSSCTTPSGTTPTTCSGGYAKPSWQTGVGVPADGKRDVPDVSLFAAGGELNDAYVICDSQTNPCTYTSSTTALTQAVGGTSVASPAMAGIMALVNQKVGAAQGNANPVFYALAAKDNRSSCNSVSVGSGNSCNFYDVTTDNIAVPCIPGSLNCVVSHSGDTVGILSGYSTTTGYDLATGLGSVNAYNLVNNWSSITGGTKSVSVTPTSLAFASTTVKTTSATKDTITVKNTGTAAVSFTSVAVSGTNASSYSTTTTCPTGSTLAAAASCTVTVSFTPQAAGTLTATVSIADGAGTQTTALTGTGAAAASTTTVSLTPTTLTFPSTQVGSTSATQIVTLKNTGTGVVTLNSFAFTGTNASSYLLSAKTCSTSLAAGASCTLTVAFKPASSGTLTASLAATDNATGSPQTVALTGTGTAVPAVTLSPTKLTFPSTAVGATSATQVVTLKNTGTGVVTLNSFGFTGTNASSYLLSAKTCSTSLAAGASCTLTVAFKPALAGTLTASLAATDNATGSPQTVALTGTGTAPPTSVSFTPASLTFPSTSVGATSASQVSTLKNNGTTAVTLNSFGFSGANLNSFIFTAKTCSTSLAAGASCTVTLAFKPAAAGTQTANLYASDSATGSPQTLPLTGTGTAAPASALSISPTSIAFPATISGTTSDAQLVTLTNSGTTAVTLSSIALGGTNPTSFIELSNCGASLAAKASCTLYVAFKPTAAGALSGKITITDNATGSPQSISLTGTGTTAPSVKLSVTSIAFPATKAGSTSPAQMVTLTNTGTATLDLTSIALAGSSPTAFRAIDTCGATLAASASCAVYVAFAPAATGSFSALLTVVDNGAASPQSVALTGTGN